MGKDKLINKLIATNPDPIMHAELSMRTKIIVTLDNYDSYLALCQTKLNLLNTYNRTRMHTVFRTQLI